MTFVKMEITPEIFETAIEIKGVKITGGRVN